MIITIGQWWKRIGADLGLRVEVPFKVLLKDGTALEFDALVKDFGAKLGMLITSDYNKIKNYKNELTAMGYGYSVMSDYSSDDPYESDSYKDVLVDWGWSGDPALAPSWLVETKDTEAEEY